MDDEKALWYLFCLTGEPQYYSMYVRNRNAKKFDDKKTEE